MTSFKNACALKKLSKALCLLRNCFSTIVWRFSCPCVQKHKLNFKKKGKYLACTVEYFRIFIRILSFLKNLNQFVFFFFGYNLLILPPEITDVDICCKLEHPERIVLNTCTLSTPSIKIAAAFFMKTWILNYNLLRKLPLLVSKWPYFDCMQTFPLRDNTEQQSASLLSSIWKLPKFLASFSCRLTWTVCQVIDLR